MSLSRQSVRTFVQHSGAWGPVVALLLSAGLNVVLSQRLRAVGESNRERSLVGAAVPRLEGATVDGQPASLDYRGLPTIVYYFSPACGWCERNWPNVKALVAGTQGRFRFVGVSAAENIKPYAASRGLTFDIYSQVPDQVTRAFRFSGTPHTVVVAPSGRITKSWMGAYGDNAIREINAYFNVQLPGLSESAKLVSAK